METYLKNFEALCTGNDFIYSQPAFLNYRQQIETAKYFQTIKPSDPTYSKSCEDVLNILYRQILQQPYWYIEAKQLFPNDRAKQGQYLYENIELAKDRFNSFGRGMFNVLGRGMFNVLVQLDEIAETNPEATNKLYRKILFATNELLRFLGVTSFEILHCNLAETPLFIRLMEFIKDIKQKAGSPYYSEIEKYFTEMEKYKGRFIPDASEPKAKPELSLKQIALIYVYNGEQITRANGEAIAKSYKQNSGEALFHDFTYYSSPKNRTAFDTEKKGKNKIERIESVIPLLKNDACKKHATNELNTLKTKLGIDFE